MRLLDAAGNVLPPPEEKPAREVMLHTFDPKVIKKDLNGEMVCRCYATLHLGPGAPEENIKDAAMQFWNGGNTGEQKNPLDKSHVFFARQAIKDFLVTADYIYHMIDEFVMPEDVELTPDEIEVADEEIPDESE